MSSRSVRARMCGLALIASFALGSPATAGETEEADPRMTEMMQAWEAYMTPGDPHREIARRAGSWKTTVSMWEAPDAAPTVSHGTSEVESIMGGRYALEHFSGTTPWGEFEGLGITAYDNFKQAYTAIWIDSMSTGIMGAESTTISDDSIECTGDIPNPMTKSYDRIRTLETWLDDDTRKMESFVLGPDGSEAKNMEILYERQ